ncbi:MAG: Lysine-tRNA ligase [Candidatus Peregrinibacteria bacterium GW2011_GWA2_47_7]|nr:MAG: Lysine-tRNA ligase [Candidatus Peregrinibacteria bacterium GW2011_GWA2_47_7]
MAMFWVDQITEEIVKAFPGKKSFLIRDEKTLSGRVHVGSLRGVVIHGVIAQALRERGFTVRYIFELNDADPMDGMPVYLDKEKFLPHMGKPLKDIPSPQPGFKNYAEYFGEEFTGVIEKMGFRAGKEIEFVRASDLYAKGIYNEWIDKVLAHPDQVRRIYKEVSGSEKEEEWNPLQVVCEKCGKVGTTTVTGFDGKMVDYVCDPAKVKWAVGCGHRGRISPYNGRGKLPWKVEWAVKWNGNHVDVEGSGKDHNAAGGSHDVATRIVKEVLGGQVPFNIPYEFLLFGGAKMSSSKGQGATAKEVSDLIPPELLRYLMISKQPNQQVDFNPEGETIPRLYDKHDSAARIYFGHEEGAEDMKRLYHFSQLDSAHVREMFLPRFSRIAFLLQIPHVDIVKETEKLKGGALTADDITELESRKALGGIWLRDYAPDVFKFEIQSAFPERAYDLTEDQKTFLNDIANLLAQKDWQGEELHSAIHALRKKSPLQPVDAFSAVYIALLGRTSGPQAGWFLEALEKSFVIERFREAATRQKPAEKIIQPIKTKYLEITAEFRKSFPSTPICGAIIKNLKIEKTNPAVEELKKRELSLLDFEKIKKTSEILDEYKAMYKLFGVDPTKRKPSPVALVDRLAKGKDLYTVNTLVDLYNLAVLKYQISSGAFNLDVLQFPVVLRFAQKGEVFQGLDDDKPKPLDAGEAIYADQRGLVIARDFNYRDSLKTAITEDTKNIFIFLDGNAKTSFDFVQKAFDETVGWILKFCGGTLEDTFQVQSH